MLSTACGDDGVHYGHHIVVLVLVILDPLVEELLDDIGILLREGLAHL